MNAATRVNSLQTYETVVLERALHPELFTLRDRRVVQQPGYELEAWLMSGKHLLRFESHEDDEGPAGRCCELVTDEPLSLPQTGVVERFFCAGERDYEHRFDGSGLNYMTTVQTEQLSENLYAATLDELRRHDGDQDALRHEWSDEHGVNLSMLDIQRYHREIHVQAYHLLALGGVVLRSQTIFERGAED